MVSRDPLEPGRNAGIRRDPLDQIDLTERGWCVGGDHLTNTLGMPSGEPHTDRTAEIVHDKSDVAEVECKDEALDIVDMILQPIAAVLRRLALAEPHVIGNDHPVRATQHREQVAEQITPCWLAVETKHDVRTLRSLVDIMHPEAGSSGEMRRVGKSCRRRWRRIELCEAPLRGAGACRDFRFQIKTT